VTGSRRFSVVRTLRNRWLAIGLIASLTLYVIVGTLVPQGRSVDSAVRLWAAAHPSAERVAASMGLHAAYVTPLFFVLIVLLAASTAACAWERTKRAIAGIGASAHLTDSHIARVARTQSDPIMLGEGIEPGAALAVVEQEMHRARLRTEARADAVDGRAGFIGLWGSPLFHWALVALMLVIVAGRLTRSDGNLVLPLNESIADSHDNYTYLEEGARFAERHTGLEFVAHEVDRVFVRGGVHYGPTPRVAAYRDGVLVEETWVRPNNPLRAGGLMLQMLEFGPAVTLALESPQGPELGRKTLALRRSELASSGTVPQSFTSSSGSSDQQVEVRIQVVVSRGAEANGGVSQAIIETATAGSSDFGPPLRLSEGEFVLLPSGERLRIAEVKDWVEVAVVNDWSVPFVYAFVGLLISGLGLSVLIPARRATVVATQTDSGWELHILTWHSRKDPMFATNIAEMVRRAARVEEDE